MCSWAHHSQETRDSTVGLTSLETGTGTAGLTTFLETWDSYSWAHHTFGYPGQVQLGSPVWRPGTATAVLTTL